jgi:hypothetical protein
MDRVTTWDTVIRVIIRSVANHPDKSGDDFSVLHNPHAQRPLDQTVFGWCEQFTFLDEQLHRSPPLPTTP